MKILSVIQARVIWLFDTRLINPTGLAMRDLFGLIKDRYRFAKAPLHELDYTSQDNRSLTFDGGVFDLNGSSISIAFTVYNDGIVAQTRSDTSHTIAFLNDLRDFSGGFGLTIPRESAVRIGYVSTFDIETDANMLALCPDLEPAIRFIESRFSSLDGEPRGFQFTQIGIWSEDISQNLAPVAFKFERRIEQRFSANRFWSQAPLQTKDHVELLGMLEGIISRQTP